MKKVKSYSAEFKIVNFPNSRSSGNPQSAGGQHAKGALHTEDIKKKLTKQNQEFINNISASGFKQFNI